MARALWMNAGSGGEPAYDARTLRRAQALLLTQAGEGDRFGARAGVHPGGGDAVALSGTDEVQVAHIKAVIYPGGSATSGPYLVQLPERTHAIPDASSSGARRDIVVARVYDDDEDSSGLREATTEYIEGTPAADPDEPTVPDGAVRLATVEVPADGDGEASVDYNAPLTAAVGGVVPVRDDGELPGGASGLYDGAVRFNRATRALEVHDGDDTWEAVGHAPMPRIAAGRVTVDNLAEYTSDWRGTGTAQYRGDAAISFPAGRFTGTPRVLATPASAVPGTVVECNIDFGSATSSGATVLVARFTDTDTEIDWVAVQDDG